MPFQGFALLRPCVSDNISRASSRILSAPPQPPLPNGRLKRHKYKKPPLAVKKVRLTPVQKMIVLFSMGRYQTDGITQAIVFLPPTAAFFYGQRPLFAPCRLLSSCKAWRWGMVATTRRKTRFPTGVTDSHKKAKPTTSAMAFCVYINSLQK